MRAQGLHRDDFIWQQTHHRGGSGEKEGYALGSDVGMGLYVPGVGFTAENGATLVDIFLPYILFFFSFSSS